MPQDDRRKHQRIAAGTLTATIKESGGLLNKLRKSRECVVLDLSREGAGLLSTTGFDPASEVTLTLETGNGLRVQLTGIVRFTNPVDAAHYRIGLHFHSQDSGGNSAASLDVLRQIEGQLVGNTPLI